jgi:hypothetical protein
MHEHPNPKLLHILNKMENSPSGKAAAAANLKAFATVTHAVALQNRSNLKATFNSNNDRCKKKKRNSNHDLLRICSPPERETDADQGEDE